MKKKTLSTLRYRTLAIGAYFEKMNEKFILKIAHTFLTRDGSWFFNIGGIKITQGTTDNIMDYGYNNEENGDKKTDNDVSVIRDKIALWKFQWDTMQKDPNLIENEMRIVFFLFFIIVSCQSKNKSMEVCEKFNDATVYPNGKIAYKKNGDEVKFYSLSENIIAISNTKTSINRLYDNNLFFLVTDLIKISNIFFITPKQYFKTVIAPTGDVGSEQGRIYTNFEYNELGLKMSFQKGFQNEENKFTYQYNNNGQLLKIIEDKFIDKKLLENKYDEKVRLISQENNYGNSKRDFFYNDKDQIIKENIKENNTNYTLLYEYNSKGELIKKYSEDRNYIYEYTYDEKGRLVKALDYVATIDQQRPDVVKNTFTELILEYNEKDHLITEITKKTPYTNPTILVNGKWQTINLEEQKKYA